MKGNCTKIERYNGVDWDLIGRRANLNIGGKENETVETPETLDCNADGTSLPKAYEPGSQSLNEWGLTVNWNPTPTAGDNPEFHHLLDDDVDTATATFYRITLTNGVGYLVHAFAKSYGDVEIAPNETLQREYTLQPTGAMAGGFLKSADVASEALPAGITAPQAGYSIG